MRETILLLCLTFLSTVVFSQGYSSKVSITSQDFKDKIEIYATNKNPIPVSIALTFNMKGLEQVQEVGQYKVIDNNQSPQLVATLNKKPNEGWNYQYNMQVHLGNFYSTGHDSTYVYALPFEKGTEHYLSQGYDGKFSHQGENAIDFMMPIGTPVIAMRDGIVAEVIEHNDDGCPTRSCIKMANSILIYHEDATFSRYAHLKVNSAIVTIGDRVSKGDRIAYSGNTGWSSEPHLHFSIFQIGAGKKGYSIPTKFQTKGGVVYLEEKKTYRRP